MVNLIGYEILDSRMRGKSCTHACIYMIIRSQVGVGGSLFKLLGGIVKCFVWMDIFEVLHGDT